MRLRTLTILAALAASATTPAFAQEVYGPYPYGAGYRGAAPVYPRVAGHGGFARPFIQGDYIGAPLTVVPRPDRLVPAAWSYGTYGVPTVSGIASPPTGQPTLTVIHAPTPRKAARPTFSASGEDTADMRVVNVSVPRR
jgi:hypothetical protein